MLLLLLLEVAHGRALAAALWMKAAPTRERPQWSTVGPQVTGGAAPPTFARVKLMRGRRRGVDRCFGVYSGKVVRERGNT